jgi:outer membrane protein W
MLASFVLHENLFLLLPQMLEALGGMFWMLAPQLVNQNHFIAASSKFLGLGL